MRPEYSYRLPSHTQISEIERIIFIAPERPTFVQADINLLRTRYEVVENIYDWPKKWMNPFQLVAQLFFLLMHLSSSKAVVCSFGGYWSVLPTLLGKIFRKPVFIIVQGTDGCAAPKIGYGVLRKPLPKFACGLSYSLATTVVPLSNSLIHSADPYSTDLIGDQGVKHHFPKLNTPLKVIPYGFDSEFWKPLSEAEKNIDFITVIGTGQFTRRDGELFLKLAERFSERTFVVIGDVPTNVKLPQNMTVVGNMSQTELLGYFQRSVFFVQLSLFEGFGCALAESMLCGCVPIVSAVNEMPEIVGDTGFILTERSLESLNELVLTALQSEKLVNLSIQARERIMEKYALESRKQAFVEMIENA
ncbi:MAG: glycosyltransferase [Flavobacteriales bacterium]|nr:glycosyltransferase [Flavobacteriales bacterium]